MTKRDCIPHILVIKRTRTLLWSNWYSVADGSWLFSLLISLADDMAETIKTPSGYEPEMAVSKDILSSRRKWRVDRYIAEHTKKMRRKMEESYRINWSDSLLGPQPAKQTPQIGLSSIKWKGKRERKHHSRMRDMHRTWDTMPPKRDNAKKGRRNAKMKRQCSELHLRIEHREDPLLHSKLWWISIYIPQTTSCGKRAQLPYVISFARLQGKVFLCTIIRTC